MSDLYLLSSFSYQHSGRADHQGLPSCYADQGQKLFLRPALAENYSSDSCGLLHVHMCGSYENQATHHNAPEHERKKSTDDHVERHYNEDQRGPFLHAHIHGFGSVLQLQN